MAKKRKQPPKKRSKQSKKSPKKKEYYGKQWKHAYRRVKGKRGEQPVLVKKIKGKEQIKIPSEAYIKKHHPRGSWDS